MTDEELERLRSQVSTLERLLEVHERVAVEQALRVEAARARLLEYFRQAPAAIAVIRGPERILEFANPSFLHWIAAGAEAVGRPIREALPEIENQGYFEILDEVFRSGEPFVAHEAPVALDVSGTGTPEEHFFDFVYQPVRDDDGEVESIFVHAVDVTRLVRARQAAESLAASLRALADASVVINSALSVNAILQTVAHETRVLVGARRALVMLRDGDVEPTHRVVSLEAGARLHTEPGEFGWEMSRLVLDAREPLRFSREELRPHADVAEAENWLGVPMLRRSGELLGVIVITDKASGDFTESDLAIVEQLGTLAAIAIDNAMLYEREHGIAEMLQRSLLPDRFPEIPGCSIAARYVPGGSADQVGGDWYDVIQLRDGRVGFVLGDVVGRGIRAASVMGQLRMAIRAYAIDGDEPGEVLSRCDRLLQNFDSEQMATVLYAVWDADAGEMHVSSAGHPPPLVLAPGRAPRFLEFEPGSPLGVLPSGFYPEERVKLDPASTLVLYSDGLVERRGVSLDDGLARLAEIAERAPEDIEALCDAIAGEMLEGRTTDDTAILAIRPVALLGRPLSLRVPADADRVSTIRRTLARYLREAHATPEEVFDIIVAVSEACANATEHAYGPSGGDIELDAEVVGSDVRIRIRDRGAWREPRGRDRGRGLQIMTSLMDAVHVTKGSPGTQVELRKKITREVTDRDERTGSCSAQH